MGGLGSGRPRSRAHIEEGLTLSIRSLSKWASFAPASRSTGTLTWSDSYTGERRASIGYEIEIYETGKWGHMRVFYTSTDYWTDEKRTYDYRIYLEATQQPLGGKRWWFNCPRRSRRVSKLYKPAGANSFASRPCFRVSYRSQAQSPYDRALSRAFKLRSRLGVGEGIGDFIPKPKGMHWTRFNREVEEIERIESFVDAHLTGVLRRLDPEVAQKFGY